jgi:hypothetical protein
MRTKVLAVVLGLAGSLAAAGQNVISARAGLIQHVEGRVLLDGTPVEVGYTQFPEVKENQVLKTEDGRAEVLLSPGSFIRMGENSALRMVSTRLTDIRLETLAGSSLIEVAELPKETSLSVTIANHTVSFRKNGLYRFDLDPSVVRVYDGEVLVSDGQQTLTLKKGRKVELDSKVMVADKFDPKVGDELYRWAAHRAAYVSMANIASAKSIHDRGMAWGASGWYWNPWYQMFTFIPFRGSYMSPFGFGFWSPGSVLYAVYPGYYGGYRYGNYGGGGGGYVGGTHYDASRGYSVGSRSAGYSGMSTSSGGMSGGGVVGGAPAAAASSSGARGGGDSGGRGSSSGGGRGR